MLSCEVNRVLRIHAMVISRDDTFFKPFQWQYINEEFIRSSAAQKPPTSNDACKIFFFHSLVVVTFFFHSVETGGGD